MQRFRERKHRHRFRQMTASNPWRNDAGEILCEGALLPVPVRRGARQGNGWQRKPEAICPGYELAINWVVSQFEIRPGKRGPYKKRA
ncbi:hypothetical protein GCM10010869_40820 [Mesorhizobium tianshanense]|uniref:Uncharacterized protein n=1 Tax=Mesorhizobium tianshanense TaxID=39844 RepID=A0A562MZU5_9HYPH|nr:hypothetical protein IQ26_06029 [Mesorhizobium tianshanense]GLS38487.1 hypothetical protein GCM10010869_40820 [Mesorhizobium tianshanense]